MSKRFERVKKQIEMRLAEMIPAEIRDPRAHRVETISVTAVRVTPDLRFARVLISIKSEDALQREEAMKAVEQCGGYLRKALGERMRLRRVPELSFVLDETADNAARLEQILREISAEREEEASEE